MSTTAHKTKRRFIVPHQHGAWVMLLTSWLCGILFAGRVNALAVIILVAAVCLFVVQANSSVLKSAWKRGGKKRTAMEVIGIALMTLLMPISAVSVSKEYTAAVLLPWLVLLVFFWGSVLRVRLLLRSRQRTCDKQCRVAAGSAAYHVFAMALLVCVSAAIGGSLFFPVILLAPASAESVWMLLQRKQSFVKSSMVGLGELLLTMWLIVMTKYWLVCFV